jgi:hypothetical protein
MSEDPIDLTLSRISLSNREFNTCQCSWELRLHAFQNTAKFNQSTKFEPRLYRDVSTRLLTVRPVNMSAGRRRKE